MKKAVYILIAISCICSTAIALYDNDTDVKYLQLFTNNGKDVIKEYEHIDSITYSKYDKDGVKQDSYMTQEIWTKDSVYRNPLLSIDSLKWISSLITYIALTSRNSLLKISRSARMKKV